MDNEERIEKGRVSLVASAQLQGPVDELEQQILGELINSYRGNILTGEQAVAKIAEISALRRLMSNLESDVSRGITAAEQLSGQKT